MKNFFKKSVMFLLNFMNLRKKLRYLVRKRKFSKFVNTFFSEDEKSIILEYNTLDFSNSDMYLSKTKVLDNTYIHLEKLYLDELKNSLVTGNTKTLNILRSKIETLQNQKGIDFI